MGVVNAPRPSVADVAASMGDPDRLLLELAVEVLDRCYVQGRHDVAAAARLASGAVVTGLHLEASQGRASVCAESGVLSVAATSPDDPIEALVAVLRRPDGSSFLIEPCGVCAELLIDHCPAATVWVARQGEPQAVRPREMLPFHHVRSSRTTEQVKETES